MLTESLKPILRRALPGPYNSIQSTLATYRSKRVVRTLVKRYGLVVQAGPFAGMSYVRQAVCSTLAPKLLGSYEQELHGVLTEILATDYTTIIDVGCAEGYYAVGLALRLPQARVHAFDIEARARALCNTMAQANNVAGQVVIEEECTLARLQALTEKGRTLIVCDCEGCEFQLLQPELVPGLLTSDLLVELHDMIDPRITPAITARFAATHDITLLDSTDRDPGAYPALKDFNLLTRRVAISEFRDGPMQWAFMRPKSGPAN
ncbi:MAG TPA: methyltransferase [Pyrinomonadaceae bacterium]|jgi:hypothetical protein